MYADISGDKDYLVLDSTYQTEGREDSFIKVIKKLHNLLVILSKAAIIAYIIWKTNILEEQVDHKRIEKGWEESRVDLNISVDSTLNENRSSCLVIIVAVVGFYDLLFFKKAEDTKLDSTEKGEDGIVVHLVD